LEQVGYHTSIYFSTEKNQFAEKMNDDPYHPSGVALPAILRRKSMIVNSNGAQNTTSTDGEISRRSIVAEPGFYWTAEEIEDKLQQTADKLQLIQKQIQRGEECYSEEAANHNIYKGWDGFIDARSDNANSNTQTATFTTTTTSSNSTSQMGGGAPRRMPLDNRWFSGSFTDIAAYIQHKPMGRYTAISTDKPPLLSPARTSKATAVVAAPAKQPPAIAAAVAGAVQEPVPRKKREPPVVPDNDDVVVVAPEDASPVASKRKGAAASEPQQQRRTKRKRRSIA
jgi:Histone acetyltransferase subunit NuA4